MRASFSINKTSIAGAVPGSTSMISLWLVPVIIADFALLPMFHIGGFPWKPGYLLILGGALIYVRSMAPGLIHRTRPIIIISLILIMTTAIGTIIFEIQTDHDASVATIRALIIYALVPLAFLVGVGDRRPNHHYLLLVIIAFATFNVVHGVKVAEWDWLGDLYNTQKFTDGEVYARGVRLPGIMGNPNITALTATILLIFVTTGFKWGHIKPSVGIAVTSIVLTGLVVVLMVSRNQILAVGIVAFGTLLYLPHRMRRRTLATSVVIIAVILITLVGMGNDRQESIIGIRLTDTLERRWITSGVTAKGLDSSFFGESGLARPLRGVTAAWDRFILSPIFGTGFEGSDQIAAPYFHNDWATVAVTGGLIGLVAFISLAVVLVRIDPLLGLPLILPGLTNSLLFAPQHLVLLMLLAGLVAGQRWRKKLEDQKDIRPFEISSVRQRIAD